MLLDRAGREYATWTFSGVVDPAGQPEANIDGTWRALEWVDLSGSERQARLLVAGPDADNSDGLAVVIARGRYATQARLVDASETVIRDTGELNVI